MTPGFVYAMAAAAVFFIFAATAAAVSKQSSGGIGGPPALVTDKVKTFAGAIAFAEGYWDRAGNILIGNRAARNNNPGDFISSGDAGKDADGYAVFSSAAAGWQRLYDQLELIINGGSKHYTLDETISDMAYTYTATQQDAWSENVASYLGVTRDTVLREVLT